MPPACSRTICSASRASSCSSISARCVRCMLWSRTSRAARRSRRSRSGRTIRPRSRRRAKKSSAAIRSISTSERLRRSQGRLCPGNGLVCRLASPKGRLYKPHHHSRGTLALGPNNGSKRPSGGPFRGSHTSAADQPEKIMALPDFTMRQLLEAGVHFGHQAHRWNPKMGQYIFGTRNNIHIVDLAQTVPMLHRALQAVSDTVAKGGRILFVGTKRQAQDGIAAAAKQSAQYFVNSRWLGGTLTNWKTISGSISRLRKLDEMLSSGETGGYTKKERLTMQRERDKLDRSLGGIKDMGGVPDLLFVIDTNKEDIAIKEARRLNIPVAAIVDTNCDPAGITYAVPGNDDAARAVTLYCDLIARAALDGISRAQGEHGVDLGAAEKPVIVE